MSAPRILRIALVLAASGLAGTPYARAIHYICVGAPNGGSDSPSGVFEYLGPSAYPSNSLARYMCENQGRIGGLPKVFGDSIPEGAGKGTYLVNGMAICEYAYSEDRGTYFVCGNSTPGGASGGGGSGTAGAELWDTARAILNTAGRFPGVYQLARGQYWGLELQLAASKAEDKIGKFEATFRDLRETVSAYGNDVVKPSVAQSLGSLASLEQTIAAWESKLGTFPEPGNPAAAPGADLDAAAAEGESLALLQSESADSTAWLSDLDQTSEQDPARFAGKLARMRDLLSSDVATLLGEGERRKIKASYAHYVDDAGFVRGAYLSEEARDLREALASGVKTVSGTVEGDRVRDGVNRGLLALRPGMEEERREAARGALTLSLGADQAYQAGEGADGERLSKIAAESADFALGLIPVVSSVNDFAQIVHGMATGFDFAGNRMSSADYALRSAAIVLGVVPAGGAVAQAVRFGGARITQAFVRGADIVRSTGLGRALSAALAASGEGVVRTVEAIGDVFTYVSLRTRYPDLAKFIDRLPQVRIVGKEPAGMANRYYQEVAHYPYAPYVSESPTMSVRVREGGDLTLYRTFKEGASMEGSWLVSFDPRSAGIPKEEFKSLFSIPIENKMDRISSLVVAPGRELRLGPAAAIEEWGGAGGGIQWDLMGAPPQNMGEWTDLGPWQ